MADGLASPLNFKIVEDKKGLLWLAGGGGEGGGVSLYDGGRWYVFPTDGAGFPGKEVRTVLVDRNGYVWFGTYKGMVGKYDGKEWVVFNHQDGLPGDGILSLVEDEKGHIWAGTDGSGVLRYDGSEWIQFTENDGLVSDYVSVIRQDRDGNLWFGTPFGVSRYDGSKWATYTDGDGLASRAVNSILEDKDGGLWFGTTSGVSRYYNARWVSFGKEDGLADDFVKSLYQDTSGNVWVGTVFGGVMKYDGLVRSDEKPPRTFVDELKIDAARRKATVKFHGGDLVSPPADLRYSYRLDDGGWSMFDERTQVSLSDLTEGKHRFQVRAMDVASNLDPDPAEVEFTIVVTPLDRLRDLAGSSPFQAWAIAALFFSSIYAISFISSRRKKTIHVHPGDLAGKGERYTNRV
jgi:ligand-binding sensor domain-containing protein